MKADDTGVRWWEPLLAFVGGNAAALSVAVVLEIVLLVVLAVRKSSVDIAAIAQTFPVLMGTLAINNAAMFGLSWWLAWRRLRYALASYFAPVGVAILAKAALSGVGISVFLNGGNALLDHFGIIRFQNTAFEIALIPHGIVQIVICLIVVSVLAPAAEEFVFRGLLLRWLKSVVSVFGAVLISAFLFGLMHAEFVFHPDAQGVLFTIELILAGVVLALWTQRTSSLRASFACHAAYNLTATLLGLAFP